MKKILFLFLLLLFPIGCAPSEDSPSGGGSNVTAVETDREPLPVIAAANPEFDATNATTTLVKLDVPGMTCAEGCPPAVKSALAQCKGVSRVDVDFATKTATITVNPTEFEAASAIASLTDFGFESSAVQTVQN